VTKGLVVAVLVATAMLGGGSAAAQEVTSEQDAIQQLVERRATAVLERDRAAFLSTVDPASTEFYDEQEQLFESLGSVPLESYALEVRWDRFGDLVRPSDRAKYSSVEDIAIPVTEERYRIRDFDRTPAIEDMFFTFVKKDGDWLIAEDSDLNDLAFYSSRHLWDYGPMFRVDGDHFVLFGHKCTPGAGGTLCPREAKEFMALAEEALARVDGYWPMPWSRHVAVLVPSTPEELKRILQITFDPSDFVAFSSSTVDADEGIRYTGHRIIFNWRSLENRSDSDIVTILAHELVHVASRDLAGAFIPIFFDEGIAEYIGHDADPDALSFLNSEVGAGFFDARLPEDYEFITGDATSIFRSYQEGLSAVNYFAQRYGVRDLIRLYRTLGSPLAPGTARFHIDRALRKVAGTNFESFENAWADSIT
jgi:hypothetical protein